MPDFEIRKGFDNMDFDSVYALLHATYWADKRSVEQIRTSLLHSECYGVFLAGSDEQVGFARIITDYATTYYLCDVIIAPEHQGHGMGHALVEYIENDPQIAGMRGILITRDANALYEKFGYGYIGNRAMVKGLNC